MNLDFLQLASSLVNTGKAISLCEVVLPDQEDALGSKVAFDATLGVAFGVADIAVSFSLRLLLLHMKA